LFIFIANALFEARFGHEDNYDGHYDDDVDDEDAAHDGWCW